MKGIETKLITFDDEDASDIVLLETELLDLLDIFVRNESDPREYMSIFDKCVSMQSTKTPLYAIMIALLAKNHKSFVEELVQMVINNFYDELNRGCYIECTLRLRCLSILSLFSIISHDSLFSFYQNMITKIQETHNATLIRSTCSSLLYIYRYIAMHEAPFTSEEYATLCSSLHTYFETDYLTSATFKNQSSGYLQHLYKENDLFIAYDQALTTISSLLQHMNEDPSIRPRVLSLDFSYCAIVRAVFEEFRTVYESGEVLLTIENPSLRDRIRLLCNPQPLNLVIATNYPEPLEPHSVPHFYHPLITVEDGLTFTLLPTYQSLILADFVDHIFTLFKPSWKYASKFIQLLKKLVTSVYEIDIRTLHNNLAFITCQTLFSFLMDTTLDSSFSQQAAATLIDLSICSINSNQGEQASFVERVSPALFKFIDTIANKVDLLTFAATKQLIQFFALYMSNTNYFWPWNKWETVNQLSPTSCYRIFISELIIACCSLSGYGTLASTVPPSILKLTELGCFKPKQPLRDQDPELRENIELLIRSKAIKMIKKHIEDQYNNRGPFVSELTILLDYCLQPKDTNQILSNIREYKDFFMVLKLDKEIMILEEIFSQCHHHPKATAMVLKELLDLSIVSIQNFFHFLRITQTNHALFYYWDIVDHVLVGVQDSNVYEELLKAIVIICNTITQEKHSSYILNVLEQMGKKYKAEFLKLGGVSEEFTKEIKSYDLPNGVVIRFLRV